MELSKMNKTDIIATYEAQTTQFKKLSTQYAEAQGLNVILENELYDLIVSVLAVFKDAPKGTGLWGWVKLVWSSEFRTAIVNLITYLKNHKSVVK